MFHQNSASHQITKSNQCCREMCPMYPKAASIPRTMGKREVQPSTGLRAGRAWSAGKSWTGGIGAFHGGAALFSTLHLSPCPHWQLRVHAGTSPRDLHYDSHLETGYSHFEVIGLPCLWLCFLPPLPPHPFFFFLLV